MQIFCGGRRGNLAWARDSERTIVTADSDFVETIARAGAPHN